jgi:protein pelota
MKILYKDLKKGIVKLKIESLNDLWTLTYIIERGDIIKAKTQRKIKLGKESDRNVKITKKYVYLKLEVEKIEFHEYSNVLRVNGIIKQGPDEISSGSYHTINLQENDVLELVKKEFLKYQIKKLKNSTKISKNKILICIHDREEAIFALLKNYNYDILTSLKGSVSKKADVKINTEDFYSNILKVIKEYDNRYSFDNIIIASPGFWKEYLVKNIKEEDLKNKIVLATCSNVNKTGLNELIKRPEVKEVLKKQRFSEEIKLVEELLKNISKNELSSYGLNQVKEAVDAGAVSDLLITDSFIQKKRQKNEFKHIDNLMRKTEKMNGTIHIITSEHAGGKKLDGLGGIAALLRYNLNY